MNLNQIALQELYLDQSVARGKLINRLLVGGMKKIIVLMLMVSTILCINTKIASAAFEPNTKQGRTVAGDFNGDGKEDMATMYDNGNNSMNIIVFLSNGASFSNKVWYSSPNGSFASTSVTGRMVAGDFNGDGKDDIVTMNDYGNAKMKLIIFKSNGSSFTASTGFETGVGEFDAKSVTGRMVAGDINGDGKDDIVTMNDYGNAKMKLIVFKSNGSVFTASTGYETGVGEFDAKSVTGRMVAGDINGDGKEDIVTMNDYGNAKMKLIVFKSNGSIFTASTGFETGVGEFDAKSVTGRMVAGDINGDGKDDIVTMNEYEDAKMKLIVFNSNGSTFLASTGFETKVGEFDARNVTAKMVAGDFNGDGKDDISTMNDYGNSKMSAITFVSNGSKFAHSSWINYPANSFDAERTTNYIDANGMVMTDGWASIDDNWFLLSNGLKLKDWQQVNGAWYYLDLSDGHMLTGWLAWNNHWYYLYSNGSMATGWVDVSGSKYYLDPASGIMQTGWIQSNGSKYFLNTSGVMQKGWIQLNGSKYYLNPTTGIMYCNLTGVNINGIVYNFDANGIATVSTQAQKVINFAKQYIGIKYAWGEETPEKGFDCSGFVMYVFKNSVGITLPRTTQEMIKVGTPVSRSALLPGDLVFYDTSNSIPTSVSHVGIYIGNGEVIQCDGSQTKNYPGVEIIQLSNSYWSSTYLSARRVL